jgi:hypothetical protein
LTSYIEYVDGIKDIKQEIVERKEYQYLNHVVLNDKQGRKNLNSIDKDIKHQIHTKQEKYSELRTRTLHHYQT